MNTDTSQLPVTLITGGNRGIGLALATQLHARGDARIIVTCRATSPELEALGVEVIEGLDVRDPSSLADELQARNVTSISTLINNAGFLRRDSLDALNLDNLSTQLEINAIAPLKVVSACLHLLGEGSKVANVSSRMGSIADNTSGGMYGYRMSKAALNIASVSLARDLAPRGVVVAILHPGYVRTGMTGNNGFIDADESASGLIARIDGLNLENSGTFWHSNGEVLPW